MLNTPLEGVVLALKALSVDRVARFPFPTPPDAGALAAAQRCLEALGALEREDGGGGGLTVLGHAMARFPVGPRHARMILQVRGFVPASPVLSTKQHARLASRLQSVHGVGQTPLPKILTG